MIAQRNRLRFLIVLGLATVATVLMIGLLVSGARIVSALPLGDDDNLPPAVPTAAPDWLSSGDKLLASCGLFQDVPLAPAPAEFAEWVTFLKCRNVVEGYPCGGPNEPCGVGNLPYFRPFNPVTRGQLSKFLVRSYNLSLYDPAPFSPTFVDVPRNNPFFLYIETLHYNNLISGYPCGGPGEPCPGVYFRPSNNATRGQVVKLVLGLSDYTNANAPTQTFEDVSGSDSLYYYIETAYRRGLINGYPCGSSPLLPCVAPNNRPYFLPGGNVTRSQMSKIIYKAGFSNFYAPTPSPAHSPYGGSNNYEMGLIPPFPTQVPGLRTVPMGEVDGFQSGSGAVSSLPSFTIWGSQLLFTSQAKQWLIDNSNGPYYTAIVFHAADANGSGCTSVSHVDWDTNLPNPYAELRSACNVLGGDDERRIYIESPSSINVDDSSYYAYQLWSYTGGVSNYYGKMTIDNYRANPALPPHTDVTDRDYMAKFCYKTQEGIVRCP